MPRNMYTSEQLEPFYQFVSNIAEPVMMHANGDVYECSKEQKNYNVAYIVSNTKVTLVFATQQEAQKVIAGLTNKSYLNHNLFARPFLLKSESARNDGVILSGVPESFDEADIKRFVSKTISRESENVFKSDVVLI